MTAQTVHAISMVEYEQGSATTDRLEIGAETAVVLGLFGEVGSVMATAKKHQREGNAYSGYNDAVCEELGDVLWYLAALCRRSGIGLAELAAEVSGSDVVEGQLLAEPGPVSEDALLEMGRGAAALLEAARRGRSHRGSLREFMIAYLRAVRVSGHPLPMIAARNLAKVRGRFANPSLQALPCFDAEFSEDERLPWTFRIEIGPRATGAIGMRWKGVVIGDTLTDNIEDADGYRFHDAFHFAHAAVLHWSPTVRSLIRHKRKSVPQIDENEDGGRAVVVEEGLTAYVFSCAKDLDFFEGQTSVSFDLLKVIEKFVRGYEVEKCPLKLWEDAILQGYDVFRRLRERNGGVIVGDRGERKIMYEE